MKDIIQLQFSVPIEVSEAVANLLTQEICKGIEQRDSETDSSLPPNVVELRAWISSSRIQELVKKVETLLVSLKELGMVIDPWSWNSEEVDANLWQEAYKRYFKPFRIGRHFIVKPSWEDYDPLAKDFIIELDPSMAFGTGLHATTQLVIAAIERIARSGETPNHILDLGCGTGILSIAAAKVWPNASIIAIDKDPDAVEICRDNIKRNHLEAQIVVKQQTAMEVKGAFNLILGNLTAEILTDLQPQMSEISDAFGTLVLSGITAEQANPIARLYARLLVWELEFSEELDGWRALLFKSRE